MSDHYDSLETRPPILRDSEECAVLPKIVARAMSAPGWAKHLAGVDPNAITSRAALAQLPLLRKSDIAALQKENPPFGGLNVTPPGRVKRLLMSPGPIFEPEGEGKDWWGAARALFAAGFRSGDIVHNSFAYHLTPGGFILESGAHALGCAVIPGGVGNTEQQLEAIAHFQPSGYVGTPDFLKILLDTAEKSGKDASSIKRALVSGAALPASLRDELGKRGVAVLQCYATAELGVIAYESEAREGMIVNEGVDRRDRAARHRRSRRRRRGRRGGGDLVQSRLSDDPARHRRSLRAARRASRPAGAAICASRAGWAAPTRPPRSRACSCIRDRSPNVAARHPELKRLRLVVGREREQDYDDAGCRMRLG